MKDWVKGERRENGEGDGQREDIGGIAVKVNAISRGEVNKHDRVSGKCLIRLYFTGEGGMKETVTTTAKFCELS